MAEWSRQQQELLKEAERQRRLKPERAEWSRQQWQCKKSVSIATMYSSHSAAGMQQQLAQPAEREAFDEELVTLALPGSALTADQIDIQEEFPVSSMPEFELALMELATEASKLSALPRRSEWLDV